jgi:hypothetical protein
MMRQPVVGAQDKRHNIGHSADVLIHARLAAITHGSPLVICRAYSDWMGHLVKGFAGGATPLI